MSPQDLHNISEISETFQEATTYDHAFTPVPEAERKGMLSMGLLWLATETTFPTMFIGFAAEQSGQSLQNMLIASLLATTLISIYGVLAGILGARTGQMQPLLTRSIFGKWGSAIVSIFLILMGSGWYSFQAVYAAQAVQGMLNTTISSVVIAVIFTVFMSLNNVIGFKGIGTFGKYLAPFLFFIAIYSFVSVIMKTPSHMLWNNKISSGSMPIFAIATILIGGSLYGNEPDVWRFAKNKVRNVAIPMVFAYAIGLFVFPSAGWAMGLSATASTPAMQGHIIIQYLFGLVPIGVIILVASQMAQNDINLYESINAMTNIFGLKRYISIAILIFIGVFVSIWMATSVTQNVFFLVAGIGASTVPTATTIMAVDVLFVPKLFGIRRDFSHVIKWNEVHHNNWIAVFAMITGVVVSIILSIPGNVISDFGLSIGIAPFEGWLAASISYVAVICMFRKTTFIRAALGLISAEDGTFNIQHVIPSFDRLSK